MTQYYSVCMYSDYGHNTTYMYIHVHINLSNFLSNTTCTCIPCTVDGRHWPWDRSKYHDKLAKEVSLFQR